MNVGISKNNIPRPISDPLAGALISGASGFLGSAVDAIAGAVNAKKQREHDKDMAALNQQNALAQMAQQNAYQVEQWERENAYNDPKAVAERYRAAGINPRAVLEGSAKGAGVAGGLSSAPHGSSTGSASNIQFGTNFGSTLGSFSAGLNSYANMKQQLASADKAEQEAQGLKIENQHKESVILSSLEKQKNENLKVLEDTKLSTAQRENLEKENEWLDQRIAESKQNILLSEQKVVESKSKTAVNNESIKESKTRSALNEQNTKESEKRMQKVESEIAQINARNAWFDRFGFYPPTGDDWQSALIGLGSKGIGKFADWLLSSGHSEQDAKKVPPKLIVEHVNASPNEQKSIEKRIDEHIKRFGNIE